MKVLLIAYHFPPDGAVGALRARNVAHALHAAGHTVTVITARLPGEREARRAVPGLDVRPIRSLPTLKTMYLWGQRQLHRKQPGQGANGSDTPATDWPDHVPAWKRHLLSLMWLLDDRTGFILPALLAAWREIRRGVDLIYTTAPPFSAHAVGLTLRRLGGPRWVAEFRDPWTDNPGKPAHLRTRWSDAAERWLERLCLRSADHVIPVTDSTRELLIAKTDGGGLARKTVVVRNGIETLAGRASRPRGVGPFRIVHIGTFYGWRDPQPFLAGLGAVVRQCDLRPDDLQVDLIGDCRWFHGISVEQAAADAGVRDLVRFRDWASRDVALQAVGTADLLLLLAQKQPAQVPTKLYEYLGARIPILAFTDAGGEVAAMLRQVGGHYLVTDHDPVTAARVIAQALRGARTSGEPVGDDTVLREWTLDRQLQRLRAALEVEQRELGSPDDVGPPLRPRLDPPQIRTSTLVGGNPARIIRALED
jgi:glycosyltransferase involved in cell wall biosynthesis